MITNGFHVLVGGGTGFLGSNLTKSLINSGYKVPIISRKDGVNTISWDNIKHNGIPECDAIINLAGRNLFEPGLWTETFKQSLRDSRINTNLLLKKAIEAATKPPKIFVATSATGIYPTNSDEIFNEDSKISPTNFPSQLCFDWENASRLSDSSQVRQVFIRISPVLGKNGGPLQPLLLQFYSYVGGIIGTGKQYFPWIHIDDVVEIFKFAIENDNVKGVLNAVSPDIITYREFCNALSNETKRPVWLNQPSWLLQLLFGTERANMLLDSQKIQPKRTIENGYKFKFPKLQSALTDIINSK